MNNGPMVNPMHSPLGGTSITNRMNGSMSVNPSHPSQQSPHHQMGGMNMPPNPPMQLGSGSNMMSNNSNSNGNNNTPVSMNNNSPNNSVGINSSAAAGGGGGPNMNSISGSNNNGPNQSSNSSNMNQNQIGHHHHPGINSPLSMMSPMGMNQINSNSAQNASQIGGMYGGPKPMPVSAGKIYPADTPMVFNPQNPNAPPIYPCGVCHKEVHDNDQGLLCESGCNFWFHR
jgi:hypothetical protein